jgi:hypothetical protein
LGGLKGQVGQYLDSLYHYRIKNGNIPSHNDNILFSFVSGMPLKAEKKIPPSINGLL